MAKRKASSRKTAKATKPATSKSEPWQLEDDAIEDLCRKNHDDYMNGKLTKKKFREQEKVLIEKRRQFAEKYTTPLPIMPPGFEGPETYKPIETPADLHRYVTEQHPFDPEWESGIENPRSRFKNPGMIARNVHRLATRMYSKNPRVFDFELPDESAFDKPGEECRELRRWDRLLAKNESDEPVPAEYRDYEDPNGSILFPEYVAKTEKFNLSQPYLSKNFGPSKKLTDRIKVGKIYAYSFSEIVALSQIKNRDEESDL